MHWLSEQKVAKAYPCRYKPKLNNKAQNTIRGQSGGPSDSKGCGFIADSPNHVLTIPQKVDYMRLTVRASGGQPTLLVLGPNPEDRFCGVGRSIGIATRNFWSLGSGQISNICRRSPRRKPPIYSRYFHRQLNNYCGQLFSSICWAETSTALTSIVPGGVIRLKCSDSTCKASPQLGHLNSVFLNPVNS